MNILDNNTPTDQNDQIQIDENKDYYAELTGPGGKFDRTKYASDDEMNKAIAKSTFHGTQYIDFMKARQDELRQDYVKLREEYNAGPKLKETLDQYFASQRQSQEPNLQMAQEDKSVPFDENKLNDLVRQHISANKQADAEDANAREVESKLQSTYGPNYKQIVSQQISQLGLSADFFNDLARKHPAVLYRTLGLEGQKQDGSFQAPPNSTMRGDPFAGPKKRTEAFYQEMRKKDPVRYRDPKTQNQMFKDANEQGDAFFDMRDLPFG